jgi:hypothetical protein
MDLQVIQNIEKIQDCRQSKIVKAIIQFQSTPILVLQTIL